MSYSGTTSIRLSVT